MASCYTALLSEGKLPPVKYKGIHEPKGRVKGFRVEIRPPGSSTKIWVGTFDTRVKAMRAFDAAVYLTGKDPYYFVYPENYFPSRTPKPSKEEVQGKAKLFANSTVDLKQNAASYLVDYSKAGEAPKTPKVGSERTNLNTTNVRKAMDTPLPSDSSKNLAEIDESLQRAKYLEVPTELTDFDWTSIDFAPECESKVDFEESAYLRGFSYPQDIWNTLIDISLPAPYDFPAIEDESFFLNFETPSKVSSKRKRDVTEGSGPVTNDRKSVGFSEAVPAGAVAAADVDWFHTMIASVPNILPMDPDPR